MQEASGRLYHNCFVHKHRAPVSLNLVLVMALAAGICSASCHAAGDSTLTARRAELVAELKSEGIKDSRVLNAINEVPRHLFVHAELKRYAYDNMPLPIGYGQTVSQPLVVAFMTESLILKPTDRVLEIGTGSGYQTAILSRLAARVYSIEIVKELAASARERLEQLGCDNVSVRAGDGYAGWPEAAPFDAVIVTAAAAEIPRPLIDQLSIGGRLVAPVGKPDQSLVRLTRTRAGLRREVLLPVAFVPLTGPGVEHAESAR